MTNGTLIDFIPANQAHQANWQKLSHLVQQRTDEYFYEFLGLPETQNLITLLCQDLKQEPMSAKQQLVSPPPSPFFNQYSLQDVMNSVASVEFSTTDSTRGHRSPGFTDYQGASVGSPKCLQSPSIPKFYSSSKPLTPPALGDSPDRTGCKTSPQCGKTAETSPVPSFILNPSSSPTQVVLTSPSASPAARRGCDSPNSEGSPEAYKDTHEILSGLDMSPLSEYERQLLEEDKEKYRGWYNQSSFELIQVLPDLDEEDSEIIPDFVSVTPVLAPLASFSMEEQGILHQLFAGSEVLAVTDERFACFVTQVLGLSILHTNTIFRKILRYAHKLETPAENPGIPLTHRYFQPITCGITQFDLQSWYLNRCRLDDPIGNFFHIFRKSGQGFLEADDFLEGILEVVANHNGLKFLNQEENLDFHDRYVETVVTRIMYWHDLEGSQKISLENLRQTNPSFLEETQLLETCSDDVNHCLNFYSYKHFYVLYCKFWELDQDHANCLNKDNLANFGSHTFSYRLIDRLFDDSTGLTLCKRLGYLDYSDFIVFLMNEEDHTTPQSLHFWFAVVDLKADGLIDEEEIGYFYQEQYQRLQCLNVESVPLKSIMTQLNDLIQPRIPNVFGMADLRRKPYFAEIFFGYLLSLNKYLFYDQRDPFSPKNEGKDTLACDWDSYCVREFLRMTGDDVEVDSPMHDRELSFSSDSEFMVTDY